VRYRLSEKFVLRWLEKPSLYGLGNDELYELDDCGFRFLQSCAETEGCDAAEADREFIDYCLSEGILTVDPKVAKRPPLAQSPIPSLRYLELQITDRCNLRCKHCYIGAAKNKELSLTQLKAVLDEFAVMQGLRLLITGGEPLMHSDFAAFNEILPSYYFRKILFTNGLLLDAKLLAILNVDEIQFSVDGMEHGHDALRGSGTFRKVMNSIEAGVRAGSQVSISTMIHSGNLREFDEMERLFKGLGVRDWTVDVPCPEGNMKDNNILGVLPETGGRLLKYGFGGGLHGGGEGFGCGLHLAAVLAGGEVCKCAFFSNEPAGTIDGGIGKAWTRIVPVKLDDLECARLSCSMIDECRGGCRYRASAIGGKYHETGKARDLYKCFHYGIMK
jgi:radical SAM protein with 4Fe4S-binding SPASM domain